MEPESKGAGTGVKPFTPQEAREIIQTLRQPAVFTDMVGDWPAMRWTSVYLSSLLGENLLRFRIGRRTAELAPQFETECEYVNGTLQQFHHWIRSTSQNLPEPFDNFNNSDYWGYADYKYLSAIFHDRPEILQDIIWADFGFPGRDGKESTLWVGSSGANTPCHIDSYGCNLVLQVEGRKTWHLFPPEDTTYLYPTRIPYEESSIFSKVNVVHPDWCRFPLFSKARPYVVTLHPGQVLYVPRRWWHYVESIDDITVSINTWTELDSDHEARVEEAITRMVVCAFKSTDLSSNIKDWLNPTEGEVTSHETNLLYLNQALAMYTDREAKKVEDVQRTQDPPLKRNKLTTDTASNVDLSVSSPPFGKHLLPVMPSPPRSDLRGAGTDNIVFGGDHCRTLNSETTQAVSSQWHETASPNQSVTSDDVLECLVNPQVIHLVSRLLLKKMI
ncbi:HSPB1-associated protein 1 isoform X1 [Pelobates fuscus]|uniref:HSPB1-associated protein 1 isoform X1 n=1 Tax=Pelobates fuscus TaxID=191477 RepID=UPI002FE47723